jgi:transglutaminase-like putative cysteine protease
MKAPSREIPARPLLWLAVALLFSVPPLLLTVTPWAPAVFLAALLAKFPMVRHGWRLRRAWWKVATAIAGLGAVRMSYSTLQGLEPGMCVLLVLMSLKILEAHTGRDFHTLVMLGWFLCLGALFISQELAVALYALATFLLLLIALVLFHRGGADQSIWPGARLAAVLMLQAVPVVLLLFLFFPRSATAFRFQLLRSFAGGSGFSDRLSPGSLSSLASSTETAFRAEFVDGRVPSIATLYWRGSVMWLGEGMTWHAGPPAVVRRATQRVSGEPVRQRIILEPHGGDWMFALDWPAAAPPGAQLAPGNYLRSERAIHTARRYEVTSYRESRNGQLSMAERRSSLQLPARVSPAVRDLAQSWVQRSPEPREIVASALQFFRREGFRYSLSPGTYQTDALDDFLFRRRVGFCEHYAAAFATLMRVAGVPARVVVGYQGGQFNELGGYIVVRQSDAHAWCEVWMGSAWERVDPTGVVAPSRVNLGFDSFLEMSRAASGSARGPVTADTPAALGRQQLWRDVRLAWDTLNFAWDSRVLNFEYETQHALLFSRGMEKGGPWIWLARIGMGVALLVAAFGGWMWWRSRPSPDPVQALYARFCMRLAKLGVPRLINEGPHHFSKRAAKALPALAPGISRISDYYIALRYGARPTEETRRAFLEQAAEFCRSARL